jgi:hypothetical protein
VVLLEDEADVPAAERGARLGRQGVHRLAGELELAVPRMVEQPRMASSVLFPAPLGPMMVTNSPARTSRSMRRSTQLRPPARSYDFSTLRRARRGEPGARSSAAGAGAEAPKRGMRTTGWA